MTRLVSSGSRRAVLHEHALPIAAPGLSRSSSNASQRVAVPSANGGTRTVELRIDDNATLTECQAFAEDYRARSREAYRHAARLVKLADHTTRQGAGYYAQQGRELEDKARAADMRAARLLVKGRQDHSLAQEGTTIDLHNLTVSQALTVVKENVNSWWASAPNPAPLYIITGKGTHSQHGKSQLNPAVSRYLDRENWRFTRDGEGVLKVTGLRGR